MAMATYTPVFYYLDMTPEDLLDAAETIKE
jgi:hypothetical protein|nr:MAG TPA: hypothetical protein [Caudoviricetes sp.]